MLCYKEIQKCKDSENKYVINIGKLTVRICQQWRQIPETWYKLLPVTENSQTLKLMLNYDMYSETLAILKKK